MGAADVGLECGLNWLLWLTVDADMGAADVGFKCGLN